MPVQHNHQGKLVLVVEDDADLRSLLCDVVRELELQVTEATDGNGAIRTDHGRRAARSPVGPSDPRRRL